MEEQLSERDYVYELRVLGQLFMKAAEALEENRQMKQSMYNQQTQTQKDTGSQAYKPDAPRMPF